MKVARFETVLVYGVLCVLSLFALFPLVGIFLAALHPPGSNVTGFSIPSEISLENFRQAWSQGRFGTYMRSSAIVTVTTVVVAGLLSILAGYAFGMMRFFGRTVLFYTVLFGLIMPFEAMLVALFIGMREAGLTDTYWSLILPEVGLSVAFGAFWMRSFFMSAPAELVEAARIDGATSWQVLWKVLFPLARPAVLAMSALMFLFTWNSFLLPLVMVTSDELRTAPVGLTFFQTKRTTDFAGLAAGALIVSGPVIIVYILMQRHFVRGLLGGAVKG
jgi:raffinose/stachyose/melibiose transport system permease protein